MDKEVTFLKGQIQKLTKERDQLADELQKMKMANGKGSVPKETLKEKSLPVDTLTKLGPFGIKANANVKIVVHEKIEEFSKKVMAEVQNMPGELFKLRVLNYVEFSEIARITLPDKLKMKAGIKLEAEYFAFSYPATGVSELTDLSRINMKNEVIGFLLFGGYVYFDKAFQIIQVNCLIQGEALSFHGPYDFPYEFSSRLQRDGLFISITIEVLLNMGAEEFCWIPPGKKLANKLSDNDPALVYWEGTPPWTDGAFVYHMMDDTYRYFAVNGLADDNENIVPLLEKKDVEFVHWTALTQAAKMTQSKISESKVGGKEDNGSICCICLDNEVKILFMPCRHLCCCQKCANQKNLVDCPKCRQKITQRIAVFT